MVGGPGGSAGGGDDDVAAGRDAVDDAFAAELRRRGVASSDPSARRDFIERPTEEDPAEYDERVNGQLERTRAMQSEGLEGLPGRAKELLTLGLFSSLNPQLLLLGAILTAATIALQLGLGPEFIHGGDPEIYDIPDAEETLNKYTNPYTLLNEPTVDPMVPLS
eukprot:PRCOL_00004960-RA